MSTHSSPTHQCNVLPKLLLALMAFILPPLPIFLLQGYTIFTKEFLISVILTALGHVPGVLFSLWYSLIEYPKVASGERDGYQRINDEEGRVGGPGGPRGSGPGSGPAGPGPKPPVNFKGGPGGPGAGVGAPAGHVSKNVVVPYKDDEPTEGDSKAGAPKPEETHAGASTDASAPPPQYEDIVASGSVPPISDVKHNGDNKVQT